MTTYQTQSKVGIIGTVPATIVGTVQTDVRTGSITVVGTLGPQTFLGTVGVVGTIVSQPYLGTVALVGTIATILSPIVAQTQPVKRATLTTQLIATVPTASMITLLNPNPNRAEFYVRLLDVGTVFLGLHSTVSTATFSVMLMDFEVYANDVYTGSVVAIALGAAVRVVVNEI
jgi:hypothetical protein